MIEIHRVLVDQQATQYFHVGIQLLHHSFEAFAG
jgi:hypothetical protein